MSGFSIEGRGVGGGRAFVIAEAGVNHNGDVQLAERLVDEAAEAGCDAVKFQTFDPELLAAPDAGKAEYQRRTTGDAGSQLDMLRGLALSHEAHQRLQARAQGRGLVFLSTPFDEASADFLERLGVPAFKVSSGDLTHVPLLKHLGRKRRPVLLSTGMATLAESLRAVEAVRAAGTADVALFHCVSSYPTVPADCNLRAMDTLRAASGCPTGWSDHTEGIDIALAAVAMGAELIEKHFTLDRSLPGPDHRASLEPGALQAMVHSIRRVEVARGDGHKAPRDVELPVAALARRSLCYRRELPAGTVLEASHLIALRPGTGIAPGEEDSLVGRTLKREVRRGDLVHREDVEDGV